MGNYVAESQTSLTPISRQIRTDIPLCFRLIVQAGLSIEVVDGDTKKLNEKIIMEVLELLKKSYVFFVILKISTCYF